MIYCVLDCTSFFALAILIYIIVLDFNLTVSISQLLKTFLVSMLLVALFYVQLPEYIYLFSGIVLALNICFAFKDNVLRSLIVYALIYILTWEIESGIGDLIIAIVEDLQFENINYSIIYLFSILVTRVICILFCLYLKNRKKDDLQNKKRTIFKAFVVIELIFTITIVIFNIVFANFILKNHLEETNYNYRTSSFMTLILAILSLVVCYVIMKNMEYRETLKANNRLLLQQKIYFENMMNKEDSLRKIRHDVKHHIAVVEHLVLDGDKADALNYLGEIKDRIYFQKPKYSFGNIILDSILAVYQQRIEENNIELKFFGYYPSNIKVNDYDLCTIFSNLLLNAIEACSKVEDKANRKIIISLNNYGLYLDLNIKNTFKTVSKGLKTSKSDKVNHGLGLKSVKDAVEKNYGKIEISYDNNLFCIDVLLQGNRE